MEIILYILSSQTMITLLTPNDGKEIIIIIIVINFYCKYKCKLPQSLWTITLLEILAMFSISTQYGSSTVGYLLQRN